MKRFVLIVIVLTALVVPATASAFTSSSASGSQKRAIRKSALETHPCGYNGQTRELSDFRVIYLQAGKTYFNIAAASWHPPDDDACELVFVAEPGYTLKSVATPKHPFVAWAPLTWGSSPFEDSGALDHTFAEWFPDVDPPSWTAISRALNR